jgi:hypothetical protein
MKLNRLLYFGYYLKNLDSEKVNKYLRFVIKKRNVSTLHLYYSILKDSLKYNISITEYFELRFFEKTESEKKQWAGTGYMYEYQKIMNPLSEREVLDDKTKFYKAYQKYFKHHALDITDIKQNPEVVKEMLSNPKIVLKESKGKCGLGTAFIDTANLDLDSLVQLMEGEGFDLAETYITQHPEMNRLSPSGVNTVRIFTQLDANNEVVIIGCRQRISVNSPVDNLAAGNIAAPIDEETGLINGPAIYSDILKEPIDLHPVTKVPIVGFRIPFWEECRQLVIDASLEHPQNRSIGWDIVVTENGPGLIEGNHDWCKLVWQLPVNRGLKLILEKHLGEYKKLDV